MNSEIPENVVSTHAKKPVPTLEEKMKTSSKSYEMINNAKIVYNATCQSIDQYKETENGKFDQSIDNIKSCIYILFI
jgi:hypothetical protein